LSRPHQENPGVAKVEDAARRSRPGGEIRGVKGEHVFYATIGTRLREKAEGKRRWISVAFDMRFQIIPRL
jgi:hypothetical protein